MEARNISSVRELRLQHEVYRQKEDKPDFRALYEEEIKKTGLQFSKHAAMRMSERKVELTPELAGNLKTAVEKARDKGAKDVAVIGSSSAFIVNVTNNTVVTTLNAQEMRNNIFTNIDSAVLL